jgi:tRNA A-37 threonylcarbamoyl transferase component Bud32
MLELRNEKNREKYLDNACLRLLGSVPDKVELVDTGVLNYVFKVSVLDKSFYFKQALAETKSRYGDTPVKIGDDLASISPNRIKVEMKVIDILQNRKAGDIEIPEVLEYDAENNIIVITDVSGGGSLLQEELLARRYNPDVAFNLGAFMGNSHESTYSEDSMNLRGAEQDDLSQWDLFFPMRTTTAVKSGSSQVREAMEKLYDMIQNVHKYNVLINFDVCPKNVIARGDGSVGVFDFETATGIGDPANDLAFLIGHYALMSSIHEHPENALESISEIGKGYRSQLVSLPIGDDFESRVVTQAAAILFYRVAGSSPAPYVPEDKREKLMQIGTELITREIESIDAMVDYLRS